MSDSTRGMGSSAPADVTTLLGDGTAAGHWVLDPAGSRGEFGVKHFWGLITVRGSFAQLGGGADIGADGTVRAG